jgi:heme/copper-type cytochrome/quinol oxidase subunit 2
VAVFDLTGTVILIILITVLIILIIVITVIIIITRPRRDSGGKAVLPIEVEQSDQQWEGQGQ